MDYYRGSYIGLALLGIRLNIEAIYRMTNFNGRMQNKNALVGTGYFYFDRGYAG